MKLFNTIAQGSFFVNIETLTEQDLYEILKNELKNLDPQDPEEQINSLRGGITILDNQTLILQPSCCGSLRDLIEWEAIFEIKSHNWQQLWIGHPWVFYKKEQNQIQFSDYTDLNLQDFKDIKPKFHYPYQELKKQIQTIRKQQNKFESRVAKILHKMGFVQAQHLAEIMTGK